MAETADPLDPFTPWVDFWSRSAQLALTAPVLAPSQHDFFAAPASWLTPTLMESQQLQWEKMFTLGEMWWTWWQGLWSPAALLSTRGWDGRDLSEPEAALPAAAVEPEQASQSSGRVKRLRHG